MTYEDIKDFNTRCDDHPAHQEGVISNGMLIDRLMEEVEELRAYIEQREWVGLTKEEIVTLAQLEGADRQRSATEMAYAVQAALKEKNT